MPRPARHDDDLPPVQRRAAIALILSLHGAAAWGLLQVQAVRDSIVAATPIFVDLLAPPAPEAPPAPPPPPKPAPPRPTPPRPVIAAPPAPEAMPAPFVVPAPEPAPPEPVRPPPPVVSAAPAPPAPPAAPAPPAPKQIPPSAIQYLVLPDIVYPSASRRLNEQGLVVVAVYMDTEGRPQQVLVAQSSGHERLDRAAVAGVRLARFRPYAENGRPVAGWARIPIPFELEK